MVLAFAIIAAGLTGPGQTIGVSVFIDHFVDDLSLSRSQVSTAYLIGTLAGAVLLPTVGRFIDRRGVRRSQVLIGLLFGLALVNMSFVNGIIWLAIGFGGIRFLGQGSLSLVSTVTVQLRFDRTRGTALGIFTTASAGVMALVPVALAVVISAVGWRNAWLVSAAVVVGLVVPIAWFGLRDLPTGTRPRVSGDPAIEIGGRSDTDSFDRGEAIRTSSFWMLAAVSGAAGMMSTALNFHQIDLLGDAGLSEKAAAALFIPQVAGSTVAGLTIGYVGDRIGTRYLPAIGMALLLTAQLLAAVAAPGVIVIIYAVVLGATGGATRTASATLQPQWFGTGHIGSIQGALTLFAVGASAIGPVALTLAEQWMGSYPPAVVLLCVVPVAAMLFALGPNTGPTRRRD
jgi:MFS family permease